MKRWIWILVVGAMGALVSCEEETLTDVADIAVSVENHADMEGEFSSIFEFVNSIGTEDPDLAFKGPYTMLPACAISTVDVPSRTLTVDFGVEGCLGRDGLTRRGRIQAVFTGPYRTAGSRVTVTLEDYFVEDVPFTGTKVIDNLGNSAGHFAYRYTVTNGSATFSSGTVTWETEVTVERVEGDTTVDIWDDVYIITGASSGVNLRGVAFTVETEQPLKRINREDCLKNFVSGIVVARDDKDNTIRLDYDPIGNEPCDRVAEVKVNDREPFVINLR